MVTVRKEALNTSMERGLIVLITEGIRKKSTYSVRELCLSQSFDNKKGFLLFPSSFSLYIPSGKNKMRARA